MKKLYSLVVALLALGFVACVSSGEGDIAPALPTDITLSVGIADGTSRVQLGEKNTNGIYPAYWNEDDRISVNGYISEVARIDAENGALAQFEVKSAVLNYPYNVLYPASAEGVVSIPAVQNYCKGSFESGTAPMYGVAKSNESVQLNHLSGVMRFAFKGAVTLESMTVMAGQGYIAGDFAVDFATGALTPSSTATSTIEYSFGNGLTLSDEEQEFFLVMPSGDFGICSVELRTTAGEMMIVRFNTAGTSAVKAGVVRIFGTATFKAGTTCTLEPFGVEEGELDIDESRYATCPTTFDGDYLVVNTPREFLWLCYNGTTIEGVTYNKIRLGADINMGPYSVLRLPSIALASGAEVDGNNKSLTGVNMNEEATSIFGNVDNINIHDLTLNDCSVNTTLQSGAGVLVGKVTKGATISNVTLNNCSVVAPRKIGLVAGALHAGTFDISGVTANGGLVETSFVARISGLAGGLVGCFAKDGDGATTGTATFTNCTTSATVKAYMETSNSFYGKMVGQLGGYNSNEKLYFVNCDGTNATLVPLYDQGTMNAETAVLSYCEAHRADFCDTTLTSATDNLLGGERYCRGEVYIDGKRIFTEWDGKRTVTILTDTVDGKTRYLIYSPYDLAKAQGSSYGDTTIILFKNDIDMGGHHFTPINYVRNLDGANHSLYNVKVVRTHDAANNRGAGFIVYASGTTTHKDLTIVGADIACNHDETLATPAYGVTDDNGEGNAYAATLVSKAEGTYTASNIHIRNGKVRGVCKVGGLIGTCRGSSTVAVVDNCSVDGCTIENYDPKVVNYYKMTKSMSVNIIITKLELIVEGLQWWYTAGECGGLMGYMHAKNATVSNCSVTNCAINCTGQPNKDVVANVWNKSSYTEGTYKSGASVYGTATTTIAGRHINQFIGDVRSSRTETQTNNGTGEYTTVISDYTVSGNTYNGVSADGANEYNHNYASDKYCEVVGCVYYTGVDILSSHVSECAGTLTFNAKGGASTTLTEAIGSGNNMDWFGGNGSIDTGGKSYYPSAPTN